MSEKKQRDRNRQDSELQKPSNHVQEGSTDVLPKITVEVLEEINNDVDSLQKTALIGKIMGRNRSRNEIRGWIRQNWPLAREVYFINKQFFIIEFSQKEYGDSVIGGRPWKFEENFVYTQKWVPNFDIYKKMNDECPVWIRLYSLPFEYWSEECLKAIGNRLGQTLNIDMGDDDLIHYARIQIILIEEIPRVINLKSSQGVWIQKLEKEETKFYCCKCKRRNRFEKDCGIPIRKEWRAKEVERANEAQEEKEIPQETIFDKEKTEELAPSTSLQADNDKTLVICDSCEPPIELLQVEEQEIQNDELHILEPRTISRTMAMDKENKKNQMEDRKENKQSEKGGRRSPPRAILN
ncbi:hypothetical protein SUGI_0155230 [Cryptomeria japonica]|nr:hypothetical protein SUGI_0155230 [Cryptomeria japonica]